MGMSTSAAKRGKKREAEFDPDKQWGLLPTASSTGGGSTYVLSGHVISSQADVFVGERMGREAQARAQRKATGQEVDKVLKQLMEKDRDGMRSVLRAREAGGTKVKEGKKAKDNESMAEDVQVKKGQGYSASIIKGIGFNPASSSFLGGKKTENCVAIDKVGSCCVLLSQVTHGPWTFISWRYSLNCM
jgi:minichromosome maintenance protein 10